jgi:hypothetical protein
VQSIIAMARNVLPRTVTILELAGGKMSPIEVSQHRWLRLSDCLDIICLISQFSYVSATIQHWRTNQILTCRLTGS